jgi:dihydroorotase
VSLRRVVELLAVNPARILGLETGGLTVGGVADITVLAPNSTTEIDVASFRSLGRNTPFDGWSLHGSVAATIVGGQTVYVNRGLPQAAVFGNGQP